MRTVRFIGLDVHAETIAIAVAESGGEVRSLGVIPTSRCAISCAPGRRRKRTNSGCATVWASFYCARAGARQWG